MRLNIVSSVVMAFTVATLSLDVAAQDRGDVIEGPASIWDAAKIGNIDAINQHLANGADINQPDSGHGTTPLSWAAILGHIDAVKLLVEKGADVNSRNGDGSTALHSAVLFGHPEIVQFLCENRADFNVENASGDNPVQMLKVDWETTRFIAALLEIEVDQDQVNKGREESAEVLRQYGADTDEGSLAVLLAIIGIGLSVVVVIFFLLALVTCYVLTSAINALPSEHRQIKTWQVWLLLIPCFNVVWNFIVFPAVSRSYESYFRSAGRAGGDTVMLGMWYCVCCIGAFLPFVGGMAGLASLVILIIYLVRISGLKKQVISTAEAQSYSMQGSEA